MGRRATDNEQSDGTTLCSNTCTSTTIIAISITSVVRPSIGRRCARTTRIRASDATARRRARSSDPGLAPARARLVEASGETLPPTRQRADTIVTPRRSASVNRSSSAAKRLVPSSRMQTEKQSSVSQPWRSGDASGAALSASRPRQGRTRRASARCRDRRIEPHTRNRLKWLPRADRSRSRSDAKKPGSLITPPRPRTRVGVNEIRFHFLPSTPEAR